MAFLIAEFVEMLEKADVSRDQTAEIAEAQKVLLLKALDTQLVSKSDLMEMVMEMENRLIK